MKVVVLLENTSSNQSMRYAHGLSLYIETNKHKILFDMGPNSYFAENAQALGIDLREIDVAFLSHGHTDHCGGLQCFLEQNQKATVYIQKSAFAPHYISQNGTRKYFGMDPILTEYASRFTIVDGDTVVDEEMRLFSQIPTHDYGTDASKALLVEVEGRFEYDSFQHEQNLLLSTEGKTALVAGCAHQGIINILRAAEQITGAAPDAVFGGFHLFDPFSGKTEAKELILQLGAEMKKRNSHFYTGHCTGMDAYQQLQALLGQRLSYLSTGSVFSL